MQRTKRKMDLRAIKLSTCVKFATWLSFTFGRLNMLPVKAKQISKKCMKTFFPRFHPDTLDVRSVHGLNDFPQNGIYKTPHAGPLDYTNRNSHYLVVASSSVGMIFSSILRFRLC